MFGKRHVTYLTFWKSLHFFAKNPIELQFFREINQANSYILQFFVKSEDEISKFFVNDAPSSPV